MFDDISSDARSVEMAGVAEADLEREAAAQALSVEAMRVRKLLEREHKLQAIRSFLALGEPVCDDGNAAADWAAR